MVRKIFKYDFQKIIKSVIGFFIASLFCAGVSRICNELGKLVNLFDILGILFTGVSYALFANVIIQPIVYSLKAFGKSMYGDESYLTHTLPATKSQIVIAKSLSTLCVLLISFGVLLVSVFILAFSKSNVQVLDSFVQMLFADNGVSTISVIVTLVLLVFFECVAFYELIKCAIVYANLHNEKRGLYGFIYTVVFMFVQTLLIVGVAMVVFAISGDIKLLFASSATINTSMFIVLSIVSLCCYALISVGYFMLSRHVLNKGVNVN